VKAFAVSSCGATAIEYAMIAGLISIVIVGSVTAIGTKLSSGFSDLVAQAWQ
jgi:pilus assembly protein Flp/PilA